MTPTENPARSSSSAKAKTARPETPKTPATPKTPKTPTKPKKPSNLVQSTSMQTLAKSLTFEDTPKATPKKTVKVAMSAETSTTPPKTAEEIEPKKSTKTAESEKRPKSETPLKSEKSQMGVIRTVIDPGKIPHANKPEATSANTTKEATSAKPELDKEVEPKTSKAVQSEKRPKSAKPLKPRKSQVDAVSTATDSARTLAINPDATTAKPVKPAKPEKNAWTYPVTQSYLQSASSIAHTTLVEYSIMGEEIDWEATRIRLDANRREAQAKRAYEAAAYTQESDSVQVASKKDLNRDIDTEDHRESDDEEEDEADEMSDDERDLMNNFIEFDLEDHEPA
jgi:hypothetical protein